MTRMEAVKVIRELKDNNNFVPHVNIALDKAARVLQPQLLNCPFCGSEVTTRSINSMEFYFYCAECSAKITFDSGEDQAIERYNNRVAV